MIVFILQHNINNISPWDLPSVLFNQNVDIQCTLFCTFELKGLGPQYRCFELQSKSKHLLDNKFCYIFSNHAKKEKLPLVFN